MKRKPPVLDKPVARHRTLLREEAELWQETLAGKSPAVRPLPSAKPSALPQAAKKKRLQGTPISFLDKAEQRGIKSGRIAIEATLDLHGLTREEAYMALVRFIESLWQRGLRTALIITGKGKNQEGMLRTLLPRWLNEPPLRERIIAYDKAHSRHGGDGAWYVRIRKRET